MGSPFNIVFYANDSASATNIANACFNLVDSFVNIYSDYLPNSELNQLCAQAGNSIPVKVSPALFDILMLSAHANKVSGGCFDITISPVTRLWRKARKDKVFPQDSTVKKALQLTGFSEVKLNAADSTVLLTQPGMQLDLGGIAQGYIAQQIIDFLYTQNITNALVDVSGDIAVSNAPPGKEGWVVGINVPETTDDLLSKKLVIHNTAVTTSGDAYQYMEHDGKKYSHIVDPKTGYGITTQRNVTVIASNATAADWLTKACSILPIKKAKKVVRSQHAEVLIAEVKAGETFFYFTEGFKKFLK